MIYLLIFWTSTENTDFVDFFDRFLVLYIGRILVYLFHVEFLKLMEIYWYIELLSLFNEALPVRPFHKWRASRSGDSQVLCSSKTSSDGFWSYKVVKGSVVYFFHRLRVTRYIYTNRSGRIFPTDLFTILELQNQELGKKVMNFRNVMWRIFTLGNCERVDRAVKRRLFLQKRIIIFSLNFLRL